MRILNSKLTIMKGKPVDDLVLTIAIPTYNRKGALEKTVDDLIAFGFVANPNIRICIIDNHSSYDVNEILTNRGVETSIDLIVNSHNYGLGANVMECFRTGATPWLWVLGDDDCILANSLEMIMNCIREASPEVLCINFSSAHGINRKDELIGGLELLCKQASFSNLLFLSSNIFNAPQLKQFSEFGYRSCFFHMPHTSMLLCSFIEKKGHQVWLKMGMIVEANLDYRVLTWSKSEMHKIRTYYPVIFGFANPKELRLISRFSTKGYGLYARILNFLVRAKKYLT